MKQGAQLSDLETLYKEEQVLRKQYFNTIEGRISPLVSHWYQQNFIVGFIFPTLNHRNLTVTCL